MGVSKLLAWQSPLCVLAVLIGVSSRMPGAAGFDQPITLFAFGQDDEVLEPGVPSREMRLSFPITVASQLYSSVYISEDGLLSFGHPPSNYIMPLESNRLPSVAAFFSDINVTALDEGKVYFREETRNIEALIRFDNLVAQYFDEDVTTKSMVVATWFRVSPSTRQERPTGHNHHETDRHAPTEKNTFQLAIGSSEGRSYAALSYPAGALGWAQSTASPTGVNWAQAGLSDGKGQKIIFKESGGPRMLTLDRRSNIGEKGTFLFRLGPLLESAPPPPSSSTSIGGRTTCDLNDDPCHPQAQCTDVDVSERSVNDGVPSVRNGGVRGFCCECARGQVGDGYLCLDEGAIPAYRIIGHMEGELNGQVLGYTDIYGFANASSGTTFLSLTVQQPDLANNIQALFAASGGVHWMFGRTPHGGKSGFLLSAGRFNRSTEINFLQDGSRVTIEESFQGLTFENMIRVNTVVQGKLPSIRSSLRLQVPEYVNVFYRTRPGELRSNSSQQLQFVSESSHTYHNPASAEEPLDYNVLQSIRFEENPCDEDLLDDPYKVIVNRASVRTDERSAPARVIMHAEVDIRVANLAKDPCDTADCGDAFCVPNGDSDYRCLCDHGAEFRRGKCVHLAPRVRTCADSGHLLQCQRNAVCVDTSRGPFCRCEDGFHDTGNRACERVGAQPSVEGDPRVHGVASPVAGGGPLPETCSRPCHPMAYCVRNGPEATCRCMEGTIGDGISECRLVTCHDDPQLCPSGAHCVSASCRCMPGYVGDGSQCTKEERFDRLRHMADRLIYSRGMTILELPTVPSGQQTPARLIALGDDTSEIVGVTVDCDHEHIYWTDSINGKIFRSKTDGKYREEVISGLLQPEGIAVDSSSRNLFWVDSELKKIQVASIDNFAHTYTLVEEGLDSPRGIAIHPQRGKVYFSDRSLTYPRIESISMDGTDRTELIRGDLKVPNMLAVDSEADELCWTDAGRKTIECVSLDPSLAPIVGHRRVVYRSDALRSKLFGIATYQNRIYWTDWEIPVVYMLDRANSSGSGFQPARFLPMSGGSSRLYSLALAPKHCPRVRTPCEIRRGDCPFMCLPTDSYGRSCVCPDSVRMVQAIKLDSSSSNSFIHPTDRPTKSLIAIGSLM
ncbi:nidogen-1-like [Tropilaelaps mercedesae]|uniref:Nidogen-1-like n=1 Tax=Tropilaelaps mercedesae TaxID=418985 RepID=A0A1V9XP20_9ACAR|nr:nidogen-1-like [Tropilaelaps mercedesae]